MLFDTTPDTSGYMIAGYAVAFGVMALYLVSLIVRTRNLNQDQTMLESMSSESKPKPAPKKAETPRKEASKQMAAKTKPKTSVKNVKKKK